MLSTPFPVPCRRSKTSGLISQSSAPASTPYRRFHAGECRHNQNRNGGIERLISFQRGDTVHLRHTHIAQYQIKDFLTHLSQRIMPTRRPERRYSPSPEAAPVKCAVAYIIIHNWKNIDFPRITPC